VSNDSQNQSAEQRKCAVPGFGFVNQKPVPITNFPYDELDGEVGNGMDEGEQEKIALNAMAETVKFLVAGKNSKRNGERLELLAFLCGLSQSKNQTQLAKRIGKSQGWVSQNLIFLKSQLRCNHWLSSFFGCR
jgi:hypothetical protein